MGVEVTEGVMHPSTGGTTSALHRTVRLHPLHRVTDLDRLTDLRLLMDLHRLALLRPFRGPRRYDDGGTRRYHWSTTTEADEVKLLTFPDGSQWRAWRANTIHAIVSAAGRQDDFGSRMDYERRDRRALGTRRPW